MTIAPLPPQISARIAMVLETLGPEPEPISRRSTTAMSVVGTL